MRARSVHRAITAVAVLANLAMWWRAFAWLPSLPERYPIHFNAAGKPDGWSTNRAAWFLLPAIATVLLAGLFALSRFIGALARSSPSLMNIPRKDAFLRLSPDGRAAVTAPTQVFLGVVLGLIQLLFLYILEGTGRVAVEEAPMLPSWPVFVFLGIVFTTLPAFLIATIKAVDARAAEEGVVSGGGAPRAR